MHSHSHHGAGDGWPAQWFVVWALIGACAVLYVIGMRRVRPPRGRRRWARRRQLAWSAGLASVGIGLTGPVAGAAETDFTAHVAGHLLAGMLGPLLLVAGAPLSLALRALPTNAARTVSRVLRSAPAHWLTRPFVAGAIDIGGLAVLYLTGWYARATDHEVAHALVHAHMVLGGYLFTASVVGVDPGTRRASHPVRAGAIVAVAAAHGILAKHLFAHPPAGVAADVGRRAAMLMYYGGDIIDAALIAVLCHQWYVATRPQPGTIHVRAIQPHAGP